MTQRAKVKFPQETRLPGYVGQTNESFGYYSPGRVWNAWVLEGALSPKEVEELVAKLDRIRNEPVTGFSTTSEAIDYLRSLVRSRK